VPLAGDVLEGDRVAQRRLYTQFAWERVQVLLLLGLPDADGVPTVVAARRTAFVAARLEDLDRNPQLPADYTSVDAEAATLQREALDAVLDECRVVHLGTGADAGRVLERSTVLTGLQRDQVTELLELE
jgi:hypothetical protein